MSDLSEWVRNRYHVVEANDSCTGLVEAWDGEALVFSWEEGGYLPPGLYTEFYIEEVR